MIFGWFTIPENRNGFIPPYWLIEAKKRGVVSYSDTGICVIKQNGKRVIALPGDSIKVNWLGKIKVKEKIVYSEQ